MQQFENCLGKHTDSLEHALTLLSQHNNARVSNQRVTFEHDREVDTVPGSSRTIYELEDRGDQYLLD